MKLEIHIIYCGVWNYGPQFEFLKEELGKNFPDQLEITGEPTEITTGYFEVKIIGGIVLHSKKDGDGLVDNSEKMHNMVLAIRKALEEERVWKKFLDML